MSTPPLAERMRPKSLTDYIGQEHLVGEQGILLKNIQNKLIPSIIFWGPPGVGKTTLANIIAKKLDRPFYTLSAINSGVKDVRAVIEKASSSGLFGKDVPILFIDEIHRFSKAQQDSLLGAVEKGVITLIGATTENPSFEVISALLSRCQVYILKHLEKEHLEQLLQKAVQQDEELKKKKINLQETEALFMFSGGDARKLLNIFEIVIYTQTEDIVCITNKLVQESAQQNLALYDKAGEQHFDIISAFIKSIRGSDPNAAVYWLARMVEGGEDVKFIARRLIILASEDIGNANPTALVIANNCFQTVNVIGFPEARIILSQCAIYLACSAKSNTSYKAITEAQKLVRETGNLSVPLHLRNAPTDFMKKLEYGKDYQYSHNHEQNFIKQEYFPDAIKNSILYKPGNNTKENQLSTFLKVRWKGKYGY